MSKTTVTALSIVGVSVRQDSDGRFSLNDLHKAAGKHKKHSPSYFLENQKTKDIVSILETTGNPVFRKEGRNGGTYVCKELVYAYAMWISAEFHLQVIRAYDALMSGEIEKARSIAARQTLKDEYLPMTDAINTAKQLEGKTAKHYHFSNENNMIYRVLLGKTAKQFKDENSVETVRDNLTPIEQQCLISLQKANTSLIDLGYDYEHRKSELERLYQRRWFNLLVKENIALEA